jgi:hypothetical protein
MYMNLSTLDQRRIELSVMSSSVWFSCNDQEYFWRHTIQLLVLVKFRLSIFRRLFVCFRRFSVGFFVCVLSAFFRFCAVLCFQKSQMATRHIYCEMIQVQAVEYSTVKDTLDQRRIELSVMSSSVGFSCNDQEYLNNKTIESLQMKRLIFRGSWDPQLPIDRKGSTDERLRLHLYSIYIKNLFFLYLDCNSWIQQSQSQTDVHVKLVGLH